MLIRHGLSSITEELMRQHGLLTSTAPDKPLPAAHQDIHPPYLCEVQDRRIAMSTQRQNEGVPEKNCHFPASGKTFLLALKQYFCRRIPSPQNYWFQLLIEEF